ncbi:hypothetical protein SAMN04515692_11854 [Leifsonia sp. CL147]|nr:hypothetical protein SAMN04515694_11722 [Leifsonia sp. CL154]SFL94851.1 hypothetical protein SAMN04515692_11854 [Leifsonia sp. CL147]
MPGYDIAAEPPAAPQAEPPAEPPDGLPDEARTASTQTTLGSDPASK